MAVPAIVALYLLYREGPQGVWWFPPCIFHRITHWYCPGCGSTRAVYRLLHGDLRGCLTANVLLFPGVLLTLCLATRRNVTLTGREYFGVIALYSFYWIVRNLPIEPFTFLMPR